MRLTFPRYGVKICFTTALAILMVLSSEASALLIGSQVGFERFFSPSQTTNQATATVSDELVEFHCCGNGTLQIDVRNDAIRIEALRASSFIGGAFPFQHVLIFDFTFANDFRVIAIEDVFFGGVIGVFPIGDPVGPFSRANVRSSGTRVEIDVGGYGFTEDSFIEVQLVPEPGTALLVGMGLLLLTLHDHSPKTIES